MTQLIARPVPPRPQWQLEQEGLHPLLARIYAARGIKHKAELDYDLKSLFPPSQLTGTEAAAILLADAIE
ncbi:MAG: single-stranded-DNA-specific exonuclease RecJ, partial [Azospira sp.]|nr:single-stranded-DNA-specific exonuclease RecJ [Azospira sp.]